MIRFRQFAKSRRVVAVLVVLGSIQLGGSGVAAARGKPARDTPAALTNYQGDVRGSEPAAPGKSLGEEQFWHLGF